MKKTEMIESGDFETSLATLERIVRELERGEMPLEKSLELFEQGIRLSRECHERLNAAERRIEILLRGPDGRPTIAAGFDESEFADEDDAEDEEENDSVF